MQDVAEVLDVSAIADGRNLQVVLEPHKLVDSITHSRRGLR